VLLEGLGSGSIGKPFGDFNKLKSGDYKGFLSSVGDQIKGAAGFALGDLGNAVKGVANGKGINALGDSKILDNIVGRWPNEIDEWTSRCHNYCCVFNG
jgi:hypothetical protein